jgi:cellulose synthase/poly-beta-1,6-N-acetylglucosamine synthase-like glycosyltransferase
VSRVFGKTINKNKQYLPSVSVLIAAFNEEKNIAAKIKNLSELNYPADRLEVLIGSDGSRDGTDNILSELAGGKVRFFRFVANRGKPRVLNDLVKESSGEALVFTDARQEFDKDAVLALVQNFNDPRVGAVSGELLFKVHDPSAVGKGMDLYWRYEKFLRKCESGLSSMLGATGAIYAVRRELFTDFPPDILVDDMYLPMAIIRGGFRAVFEQEALAYDIVSAKEDQEFKRKVRTLSGNYQVFTHFPGLFNPFRSPVAFQLFSHKFMRLMVPFFMIAAVFSNLRLVGEPAYAGTFAAQCLFYGLAWAERRAQTGGGRPGTAGKKRGIGYIPYTFCLLNYSALMGFFYFLTGRQKVTWDKAYDKK